MRISREKLERVARLNDPPSVKDKDAVVVKDGVEFMRHGEDGMGAELFAYDALHDFVGFGIDASRNMLASIHFIYVPLEGKI